MNPFESDIYDINLPVQQGCKSGDCWLLSAVYSLAQSTIGQEILKEVVENNFIKTTVNFKGIDTVISIDNEEIAQAIGKDKYSSGSKSFIIFELAFEKLREKVSIVNPHNTDIEIVLDRLDFYTFLKSIEYCQL